MNGDLKEACGIIGVYSFDEGRTSGLAYSGMMALQHRGQESCGMAVLTGSGMELKKSMGLVANSFSAGSLAGLKGRIAIGHTRYSTAGSSDIKDAQPIMTNSPRAIVLGHNGNIVNFMELKKELAERGVRMVTTADSEIILHLLTEGLEKTNDIETAVSSCMDRLEGSYCVVSIIGGSLVAFRDPLGFRPLCFGWDDETRMVASESVAMDMAGIKNSADVNPGEMIVIDGNGNVKRKQLRSNRCKAHCMFEFVYFSRPDSVMEGRPVYDVRVGLGKNLAKTYKADADLVIPVPDSARSAAEGVSMETGIPMAEGLIKNRYVSRTFIMPTQEMRDSAMGLKLNPIRSALKGKDIILIDDSIVRGTTTKKIVSLVKKAGARRVEVWVTCPPLIAPCFYGIDMATHGELIAANNSVEEIRKAIGADALRYQTTGGLLESIGMDGSDICTACLTGRYPTPKAQAMADRAKGQPSMKRVRHCEMVE